jgi:hypothetical protein
MSKSHDSRQGADPIDTALDLEFPIAPDFLSLPPQLRPEVMLRRLEETMPWRSTRPGEEQRRLAAKVDVEFVL